MEFQRMPLTPEMPRELARGFLAATWEVLSDDLPDPGSRPDLDQVLYQPPHSRWEVLRYLGLRNADPRVHRATNAFLTTVAHREVDSWEVAGMLILLHFPEENPEHPSYPAFNLRWSKKELMAAFEDWVDHRLIERKKAGLKQEVPQKRVSIENYRQYLRAYDLRMSKLTFPKIERQIWPNSYEIGRKASQYYLKGKALVKNPPLLSPRTKRKRIEAQPSVNTSPSKSE